MGCGLDLRRWQSRLSHAGMVAVGIAIAYALARTGIFIASDARLFGDTVTFSEVAETPWRSADLWAGTKPWPVPIAVKAIGWTATTWVFLCASIGAWLWLAWEMLRSCRSVAVGWAAAGVLLAMSLTTPVSLWDNAQLSEAPALTLTVALFAAWLRATRRPIGPLGWAGIVALAVLWLAIRDSNAYIGLVVGVGLGIWGLARTSRRSHLLIAGAAVITLSSMAILTAGNTNRTRIPLQHVMAERVIPNPEVRDWFIERGMPFDDSMPGAAATWAQSDAGPLITAPRYQRYRKWLYSKGPRLLQTYLLTHPVEAIGRPARDWQLLLNPLTSPPANTISPEISFYAPPGTIRIPPLEWSFLPRAWLVVIAWLAALALMIMAVVRTGRLDPRMILVAIALPAAVAGLIVTWNADPLEIPRHVLIPVVLLRLLLVVGLASAIDRLSSGTRNQ